MIILAFHFLLIILLDCNPFFKYPIRNDIQFLPVTIDLAYIILCFFLQILHFFLSLWTLQLIVCKISSLKCHSEIFQIGLHIPDILNDIACFLFR